MRIDLTHHRKLFLSLLLGMFILPCFSAQAIEYEQLGGKPAHPDLSIENSSSWFIYNIDAGKTMEDGVQVVNSSSHALEVVVYAADTTPSSDGGFALKQFTESKEEVGSWVSFYLDDPPEKLLPFFEESDKKISSFCNLSQEDLLKKSTSNRGISNDQFVQYQEWCKGKDVTTLVLKPLEQRVIPFTFHVPENADAGEHTGGILIQKKALDELPEIQGSAVRLTMRLGVRIYETVPGEIHKQLALSAFDILKNFKEFDYERWWKKEMRPEEYTVSSQIYSNSNVSVTFDESLIIQDLLFGKNNQHIDQSFQVLKNSTFTSNASWHNPRFGHFSFIKTVSYKDTDGNVQLLESPEIRVWIFPWREIVFVVALLFLSAVCFLGWRIRYKRRYGGIGWQQYTIQYGDNIQNVAQQFSVDWKILTQTNKLKPPYLLDYGNTLLVPNNNNEKIFSDTNASPTLPPLKNPLLNLQLSRLKTLCAALTQWRKTSLSRHLTAIAYIILSIVGIVSVWGIYKLLPSFTSRSPIIIRQQSVSDNSEEIQQDTPSTTTESNEQPNYFTNILIVNGGTPAGSAATLQKELKRRGYLSIATSNALSSSTGVILYFSQSKENEAAALLKTTQEIYPQATMRKYDEATTNNSKESITIVLGR